MRLAWGSALLLGVGIVGCARPNPAFDEYLIADGETTNGDGDGDSSESNSGDGDGDPTTTTNGDGDGDPNTGDGDGEDPTTGDGDGDPDTTTGDGDGDPLPVLDVFDPNDICEPAIVPGFFEPFLLYGTFVLEVDNLPGFANQQLGCQELTICNAAQELCSPETPYFTKLASGQNPSPAQAPMQGTAIQLHFTPGNPDCDLPPLFLDPNQTLGIFYLNDGVETWLEVRMPCFEGTDLRLWVADDGSTFYDKNLTIQASVW